MTPFEILGVSSTASPAEITAAYRTLAQIFHPDRFHDAPDAVRAEADRRMRQLNEAYAFTSKRGAAKNGGRARAGRYSPSPSTPTSTGGSPWDGSIRATQAAWVREARQARERDAVHGWAVAKPKPDGRIPAIVAGLGEALVTDTIPCRRCGSIQWLPEGWRDRLADTLYACSVCDRVVLSRRSTLPDPPS
ncbi:hypothetical protein BH20ACT2_BH20ACT2_00910 [soil metagenome]